MIITITGTNTFLVQTELKKLTSEFDKKYGDMAVERLDGEEASYEKLAESLQSPAFLSPAKLVIIKNPSQNKQFGEKFESLLSTIPENIEVILVESKLDKRTAFYKILQKKTDFREYVELSAQDLP